MNTAFKNRFLRFRSKLLNNKSLTLAILFAVVFSAFLMFSTVSYKDGSIMINEKLWSDFQSHIPLIRSFSKGDNIPPEYPLYSGEKIRYHFLFYFLVGTLERIGLRIDIALNIMSTIGMAGLLIAIYLLAKKISKSKAVGWLSMIMLLLNSSFSWGYFFDKHTFGAHTFKEIINSTKFASFGPYDDQVVSAFWNLNIYTNQRHLAFSFALMFLAVWAIVYSKKYKHALIGIVIIAMMSWMHKAILMILFIALGFLFLTYSKKRKRIFLSTLAGGLATLPGLAYLNGNNGKGSGFNPGFIYDNTTWKEFKIENDFLRWLAYWWLNLGILPFTALLGWIEVHKERLSKPKKVYIRIYKYFFCPQRVWLLIALFVFGIANIVAFAQDVSTNHKLINFSVMILNIYAAIFVVNLFRKNIFNKLIGVAIFLLLIMGGLFDIFPVINDTHYYWNDIKNDPVSSWIDQNTLPSDKFFNATYNTSSVTITGRKIYYGWDYFAWSMGYDMTKRNLEIQNMVTGLYDKNAACEYFKQHDLRYILSEKVPSNFVNITPDPNYFDKNFTQVGPKDYPIKIYSVPKSCLL
jgi:hypothetical protein